MLRKIVSKFGQISVQNYYSKTIGIDLGTTNSCVAYQEGGEITVIENSEGNRITPSCVAVDPKNGNILIGEHAKRQAVVNPKNTFYATKRLIGRKFKDPIVAKDQDLTSFLITEHSNGDAWIKCDFNEEEYSPTQIAGFVLSKMKETAEEYFGEEVTQAVVTVPAYFNDSQKRATKEAGLIAGLDVKRIINEPTAAALAYGLDSTDSEGIVAVFDLGGGTFDISILEILKDEDTNIFEVKSTNGDTHLGGEDFDQVILDYVLGEFKEMEGIDLKGDPIAVQRIKDEAERTKKMLDTMEVVDIQIPFIVMDEDPKNLEVQITKEYFENACSDFVERAMEPCKLALIDAQIAAKEVDHVLLVGGMTRMPLIVQSVMNFFGQKPSKQVNPDECVAMGAAIQGGILSQDVEGILLVDITPLSLGIEVVGDVFSRIIPRNSTIPTKRTEQYTTHDNNQTTVNVRVFQGEREIASANKLLGDFTLHGVPAAPAGVPQILVTFEIDANGIINVTAKDKASGESADITVEGDSGLTDYEIEKMISDAEKFKEQDLKIKSLREMKNQVDQMMNDCRKNIKELGDLLEEEEIAQYNDTLSRAEVAASSTTFQVDFLDTETERLLGDLEELKSLHGTLGERVYLMKAGESENPGGDNENE